MTKTPTQTEIETFVAKCPTSGKPRTPTGGEVFRGITEAALRAGLVRMEKFYNPTGDTRFGFIRVGA